MRKILEASDATAETRFGPDNELLIDSLLHPTHLYGALVKELLGQEPHHAMAHITGGGIPENLPRCLPAGLIADVDAESWPRRSCSDGFNAQARFRNGICGTPSISGLAIALCFPRRQSKVLSNAVKPRVSRLGPSAASAKRVALKKRPCAGYRPERALVQQSPTATRENAQESSALVIVGTDLSACRRSKRRHIRLRDMPFNRPQQRTTRRRSSAGPTPPRRPAPIGYDKSAPYDRGSKTHFPALKDHGKVFVADMPFLADGQLASISKEAAEVLVSLERRISELEQMQGDRDTLIKACTKRDVTHRFLKAIEDEQQQRRDNPAIRMAAGESLPRTFLEIARHRLPGATFDSLLQEALTACENSAGPAGQGREAPLKVVSLQPQASSLPVVVSPILSPAIRRSETGCPASSRPTRN